MSRATVLLADDHAILLEGLVTLLQREFTLAGTVTDGTRLIDAARKLRPDVIVTDLAMPGMSGPELARRVRAMRPGLPIVFISGYSEADGLAEGSLGHLVRKPFRAAQLHEQIEEAIDQARAASVA